MNIQKIFEDYKTTGNEEALSSLLESRNEYIKKLAKKLGCGDNDEDDFEQEANLFLIEKIKNMPINGSIYTVVTSALIVHMSEYMNRINENNKNKKNNVIYSKYNNNDIIQHQMKQDLDLILSEIDDDLRYVLVKYYGYECDEMSIKEIANERGIGVDRVRGMINRALFLLRNPKICGQIMIKDEYHYHYFE